MRDLKFRVWDEDRGSYLDKRKTGVAFNPNTDPVIIHDGELWQSPNNVVIEEYTGVKDVKGNEIFEGDIVVNVQSSFLANTFKWCGDPFEVEIGRSDYLSVGDISILGNIHENANLLRY